MNLPKILKNKKINKFVTDGSFIDFRNYINNLSKNFEGIEGKTLFLFNKLRGELNLLPVGILRDDEIKGGLSDDYTILDIVDKHKSIGSYKDVLIKILDQLKMGVSVEMEHTNNPKLAFEIAMDHLYEMPDYYDKLSTIEEKFASKAQAKYFYARAKEGGKEGKKWKKMADEYSSKTNFDKIPEKVNERIISYTKDSSVVEVKDECKLGGGKICNQGDINALKITKIKENVDYKIRYKLPNFEFEWEEAMRYPEFLNIGKNKWIELAKKGYTVLYSEIKNKLGNVNLDFESLENDKKQRFLNSFKSNKIEIPIAVKFSEKDYDLLAGNTRLAGLVNNNINPLIWIIDINLL